MNSSPIKDLIFLDFNQHLKGGSVNDSKSNVCVFNK